jgi:hypothetical protein
MIVAEKLSELTKRFHADVYESIATNAGRTYTLTDKEMRLLLDPIIIGANAASILQGMLEQKF